ncbi:MAG: DUF3093 domain-containing protein [Streptosporangiaceae bacterium]
MRVYHERLRVPVSWWVLGMITAVTFASFVWAGFSVWVAIASYVVIVGGCAAVLARLSFTAVEVADGQLRAGRQRLPLSQVGEVAALDAAQSRALRGPRADPAAVMLFPPFLTTAVYLQVSTGSAPYWLVGTRRPAELAAAVERARPQARAGDSAVG